MLVQNALLIISIRATEDLTQARFVGFTGGVCAAGAKAAGTAEYSADIGEMVPVNTHGVVIVEAGGAVAVEDEVASDALGRAVTVSGDAKVNGIAMDAATGAGERIRIMRGI